MRASPAAVIAILSLLAGMTVAGLLLGSDVVEHVWLFLLVPTLFLLGFVPIAARFLRGELDLFEIILPYWLMFFLFYGCGAIFVLTVDGAAADPGIPRYLDLALAYCTLGFACAMIGYAFAGRIVPVYRTAPGPNPGWFILFGLYSVGLIGQLTLGRLGYWGMTRHLSVGGLDSLLSQLSFLATFALFYAFYMLFAGQASRSLRILLFCWMIPMELVSLWVRLGNKTALMWFIGVPLIAFWYARGRIPWKTSIAALLVVVFVVFPLYWTFRTVRGRYYSQEYRIQRSIDMLSKQQASDYADFSLKTVARRLSIINSTAVIVRECGTHVDYQYGRTLWLGIISVAIPRIIWPDKPLMNIGVDFGKTFRITGFKNYSAVSQSMVGELYWNLHVPGIIAGMFLMGFWLRALYQRFGANRGANPLRLAMYVPLMFNSVTNAEAEIGGLFGGLVKSALILLVLEKGLTILYASRSRQPGEATPELTTIAAR